MNTRSPVTYETLGVGALLLTGGALWWLDRVHPAALPVWLPWEFSWTVFLATGLSLGAYARGLIRTAPKHRPPLWRTIAFVTGVLSIYAVLQSHFDYAAQHMFFIHRLQHLVLHHLGPFLIALGAGGECLMAGLPRRLRSAAQSRPLRIAMNIVQQPVLAPVLFVGLIYFWLIPQIHFRAMLDVRVYDAMNWSMAVDGIWFWSMVLDPRPKPPARLGFPARILLALLVMPPQILLGAFITFTSKNLYPVYALCGRLLPIPPLVDQGYGGLILWIPGTMMSGVAILLVLNFMRQSEESAERASLAPPAALLVPPIRCS